MPQSATKTPMMVSAIGAQLTCHHAKTITKMPIKQPHQHRPLFSINPPFCLLTARTLPDPLAKLNKIRDMREVASKVPKKAFFLSVLLHAVVLGLIVWGGMFFHEVEFGGESGGGVVSVWVSDSSNVVTRGNKPAARTPVKREAASSSGGTGLGDGSGGGIGHGKNGDPTLSAIWKKINGAKYYPLVAKQRRAEGLPRVTFKVNADGSVFDLKLAATCGSEILDNAAIETVRRAAPLPFYPMPITVTVQYTLK